MDLSLVSAAVSAIRAAKDISSAASSVRDWNLLALEMAKMNEQLLKAQDALFSHNAQLLSLQQELLEATGKLRKAEDLLADRARYLLTETDIGQWAYREAVGQASQPAGRAHFLCQPCFDSGKKSVLRYASGFYGRVLHCSLCKNEIGASYVQSDLAPRGSE